MAWPWQTQTLCDNRTWPACLSRTANASHSVLALNSAAMLLCVLAQCAERALLLSIVQIKSLIYLPKPLLIIALQALNLLIAELHQYSENMRCSVPSDREHIADRHSRR